MKKLLIASLCFTTIALTACDKKTNESNAASQSTTEKTTAHLSSNHAIDIKHDLSLIQTLSDAKAQQAIAFQTEIVQAAQKKDKEGIFAVFTKMKSYVQIFNTELDGLELHSAEAVALREKMKKSNNLSIEITQASRENPPNLDKLTDLQHRAAELQKSLIADMQKLQTIAEGAK